MNNEQSIAQIKQMPNGSLVTSVMATISEVKPIKTVTGQRGPVTVQGIKLTQGNDFIYADVWGQPDMASLQNQTFIINSSTRNGTISGLSVKEKPDSRNPARSFKNLVISKSAQFHPVAPTGQHSVVGGQIGSPAQQSNPSGHLKPVAGYPSDENTVRERLNKYANLYAHCLVAGTYVADTYGKLGGTMTPEQFQACVSALFINASKDGLQSIVAGGAFVQTTHQNQDDEAIQQEPSKSQTGYGSNAATEMSEDVPF